MKHKRIGNETPVRTLPEVEASLAQLENDEKEACFHASRIITDYVVRLLLRRDYTGASSLTERVANVYQKTKSGLARLAIENVFVYRITDMILMAGNREELMKRLPAVFRSLLYQQLNAKGT